MKTSPKRCKITQNPHERRDKEKRCTVWTEPPQKGGRHYKIQGKTRDTQNWDANILKLFMAPHSFAIFKRAVCLHGYLTLTTHSRGFHILHLDDLAMPTLRDKWFCAPLLIKDADFGFTGGRGWNREWKRKVWRPRWICLTEPPRPWGSLRLLMFSPFASAPLVNSSARV